ncbi:TetR/AcrR family transcriptional regulator [Actinomadura parmotrematis]|nr:TetR/AcrR family transcriptional regulator [Actinomadura parmotrematis]
MGGTSGAARSRNRRGQGELLREEIVTAALRMLDELGDEQLLSLRAVAREVGIAATSVYLHFADRDALVAAALERYHRDMIEAVDTAAAEAGDPVGRLRARVQARGDWIWRHPGLYRVLHEGSVSSESVGQCKQELADRTTAAVREVMEAGLAPEDDPEIVALDLRSAVHGAVSMRLHQPDVVWPPLEAQVERYLKKIVGVR